jgi:hypothetical protein
MMTREMTVVRGSFENWVSEFAGQKGNKCLHVIVRVTILTATWGSISWHSYEP